MPEYGLLEQGVRDSVIGDMLQPALPGREQPNSALRKAAKQAQSQNGSGPCVLYYPPGEKIVNCCRINAGRPIFQLLHKNAEFLRRIVLAEADAQNAVGRLLRKARSSDHMAGFTLGTGGACGDGDVFHAEMGRRLVGWNAGNGDSGYRIWCSLSWSGGPGAFPGAAGSDRHANILEVFLNPGQQFSAARPKARARGIFSVPDLIACSCLPA